MPIYEFACPKCRVIFNFLSKRVNPDRSPTCPKCGNKKMDKQLSRFSALSASTKSDSDSLSPAAAEGSGEGAEDSGMPDMNDPRIMRAMGELERDMEHLDENNPRHMAHMMRKMKDLMPPGTMPKELDTAIRRLEAGEDPEKVEADMGDIIDQAFGAEGDEGGGSGGGHAGYSRDTGLYDY